MGVVFILVDGVDDLILLPSQEYKMVGNIE